MEAAGAQANNFYHARGPELLEARGLHLHDDHGHDRNGLHHLRDGDDEGASPPTYQRARAHAATLSPSPLRLLQNFQIRDEKCELDYQDIAVRIRRRVVAMRASKRGTLLGAATLVYLHPPRALFLLLTFSLLVRARTRPGFSTKVLGRRVGGACRALQRGERG